MNAISAEGWIMIGLGVFAAIGSYSGAIWYIRGQFAELKEQISSLRSDLIYLGKEIGRLESENDKEHRIMWEHLNATRLEVQGHGQEIAVLKSSNR